MTVSSSASFIIDRDFYLTFIFRTAVINYDKLLITNSKKCYEDYMKLYSNCHSPCPTVSTQSQLLPSLFSTHIFYMKT